MLTLCPYQEHPYTAAVLFVLCHQRQLDSLPSVPDAWERKTEGAHYWAVVTPFDFPPLGGILQGYKMKSRLLRPGTTLAPLPSTFPHPIPYIASVIHMSSQCPVLILAVPSPWDILLLHPFSLHPLPPSPSFGTQLKKVIFLPPTWR